MWPRKMWYANNEKKKVRKNENALRKGKLQILRNMRSGHQH